MTPTLTHRRSDRIRTLLLALALAGLVAGLALRLAGRADPASIAWTLGTIPVLAALLVQIGVSLGRGEVGLDIVAALSMTAALLFGETLAAAVVALMYSGGSFLESYAEGRARRDMHALLSRVPRTAAVHRGGGIEQVPLEAIAPGDRLLVRQGEVVPVDGTLVSAAAYLNTAALTGEPLPVRLATGAETMSGATNAGEAFDMIALRPAADSTYAGIVRLVAQAERSRAPMSRLADRWSLGFLAVTLLLAGGAWWFTGDPIRAVAVLVVATPCPLILAVPVAFVAGLSRASRHGVLVKGAQPLEAMARVRTLILDKTGTLTDGRPQIVAVHSAGMAEDEVLRLGASLDQASQHPAAQAIVAAARDRGLVLSLPAEVAETPGEGVAGRVDGRPVRIGGDRFVAAGCAAAVPPGLVPVAVAVDGRLAGHLVMADVLRDGTPQLLEALRAQGIRRIVLATGDRADVAATVAGDLGLDAVHAELAPGHKVGVVRAERPNGPVMMVGDGVNDAPALAAADVGVAMGARGAAASAEAADVVLLVDRIDPLAAGIEIARRARGIAVQSVVVGIGLSVLCMVIAALGHLTPVQGALIQEAIDVSVILNALRALAIRPRQPGPAPGRAAPVGPAAAAR